MGKRYSRRFKAYYQSIFVLLVDISCYLLLSVVICCYPLLFVVIRCYLLLSVVICCYLDNDKYPHRVTAKQNTWDHNFMSCVAVSGH